MGSTSSLPCNLSPFNIKIFDPNSDNVSVIVITENALKKLQGQVGGVKSGQNYIKSDVSCLYNIISLVDITLNLIINS